MYKKVNADLNFAEREQAILNFWQESKIFEQTIENTRDGEKFVFYEGPPTANGEPGVHHVIARAIKDVIPRYKTMKGYHVLRKAGWDTHGLPVELEIEKKLGINGKGQIEEYGIAPFISQCKESVWKYKDIWEQMSERIGFWLDYNSPYVTYDNNYIESVWWALKTIWDKGLLYKGHKVLPYCGRCGTSLSSHEVAQGYKELTEQSVIAQFKVRNQENEYILAWTTTPWTLPSNVALCVNPEEVYVRARQGERVYILAKALVKSVLGDGFEIIEEMKGKELEKLEYVPLFDFVSFDVPSHYVVCDSYVLLTEGTGVVHQAPAFGDDDNRVARKYGLPFVQLVNDKGEMTEETPWAGIFAKKADPKILNYMKEQDTIYKTLKTTHNYPHCWRCSTPLLYYARSAWFIEMSKMRDKLMANNEKINWMPENVKHGRFGNFLENVIDWSLSRERYWGTPLPIWECSDCGDFHAIGSVLELENLSGQAVAELHKPHIDEVFFPCKKCNGTMKRVPEVIDCWFDSGSMPFAQHHYPFENKEFFEENFPADFISEGMDQTRGWFYTLHAISTLLFDAPAYKNVIVAGLVLDDKGFKMSKSKGNKVPWDIVNEYGADTMRWYFYSASAPWLPSRFDKNLLDEVRRKFLGTLYNTYAFYVLYANIDNFDPSAHSPSEYKDLPAIDRWLLSRLNTLIKFVDEGLAEYKLTETSREIARFVDELSNWYVRRSRERFWASGMEQDKIDAYTTLHTTLVTLSKLCAPYIPFMAEEIYQNLAIVRASSTRPQSVHLCNFPVFNASFIDTELEKEMGAVLSVVTAGRAARNTANIKNRQPLQKMFVQTKAGMELSPEYLEIIKDELNIKAVEPINDASGMVGRKIKPNLKILGPRYGKILPKIGAALAQGDGAKLYDALQSGGITLNIDDAEVSLTMDDVLVEDTQQEGLSAQMQDGFLVVLDTTLTPELIEEGFVREIISKIQTMRKEAGFEVMDKISIEYDTTPTIQGIIEKRANYICNEVLSTVIAARSLPQSHADVAFHKTWDINGENTDFWITKQ